MCDRLEAKPVLDLTDPDTISALSSVLTPVVVVIVGVVLTRRQSRNQELVKVRLDYYQQLAPDLNRLMCYMTFIGSWRDDSPVAIVALKRALDARFYCAASLFSSRVLIAYSSFMDGCFDTFGRWGDDARLNTSAYRRRQGWQLPGGWDPDWDQRFAIEDHQEITSKALTEHRERYDLLLSYLVKVLDLSRARAAYPPRN